VRLGRGSLNPSTSAIRHPPSAIPKIIPAEPPDFSARAAYDLYTDDDIAHRIIYVEASRAARSPASFASRRSTSPSGRPAGQIPRRDAKLLDRGLKQFKFVDRTFNLKRRTSRPSSNSFWRAADPGILPFRDDSDRLPESLREVIARFPPARCNSRSASKPSIPKSPRFISRRQDYDKLADNFHFLRAERRPHPRRFDCRAARRNRRSFAAGFDRLIALGPQEIQVGILKRLRGTRLPGTTTGGG